MIKKAYKILFLSLILFLSACNTTMQSYEQSLNYEESTNKINNPDQGFYHPIYVKLTEHSVTYNKNIVNDTTQLYHLRVDISAFSKAVNGREDIPISQDALVGIRELLSYIK